MHLLKFHKMSIFPCFTTNLLIAQYILYKQYSVDLISWNEVNILKNISSFLWKSQHEEFPSEIYISLNKSLETPVVVSTRPVVQRTFYNRAWLYRNLFELCFPLTNHALLFGYFSEKPQCCLCFKNLVSFWVSYNHIWL